MNRICERPPWGLTAVKFVGLRNVRRQVARAAYNDRRGAWKNSFLQSNRFIAPLSMKGGAMRFAYFARQPRASLELTS
jgi:hypothetical protein